VSGLLARPLPADGPATAPAAGRPASGRAAALARDSLAARLTVFAALAAYGAIHWAMLVVDAPAGRTLLTVVVAVGGAAALGLVARAPLPRPAVHALAALVALVTFCLGLMAAGLPARLLGPENWSELFDGIDRGLAGVRGVEWPYDGPDEWIRRTIMLGAPLLLAIAAAMAFWPVRAAAPVLRVLGLVTLLVLYGTAVTEHDPGRPLLRGLGLLVLVAAWLWLPRVPPREGGMAAAVVVGVGILSLPAAAALDGDRPWWDYRAWNWFGGGKSITFDWTHQYGPLDWPREGTTLLNVKADRPHYWKAEVLNAFDGLRWGRTASNDTATVGAEFPFDTDTIAYTGTAGRWDYFEHNRRWDEEITFTVRSLSTDLVIGAGVAYDVDGVQARPSADGTTRLFGDRLQKGDSYVVDVYAPDPTAAQMRGAPSGYAPWLTRYTRLSLPNPGDSATQTAGRAGANRTALLERESVVVPLRGDPLSGDGAAADKQLFRSRYGPTYELARSLAAGQGTQYDVVKAIERHLQRGFVYSERVPTRVLPLQGFLLEDRRGYCQQFSGAMALMLRMVGIPARVAAGFSPGSFNRDTDEYRVRDLDAHSWVEVWFQGIGWVPFDPTPAAALAEGQSSGVLATSAARQDAGDVLGSRGRSAPLSELAGDPGGQTTSDGGRSWLLPLLGLALLALAAGVAVTMALRVRRRRALGPRELAEAQLAELRRALVRLGWELPAATTLLALEGRLARAAGPTAAAYAGALRANRYDPRAPAAPGTSERRSLRRELTARGGLRARLRGLVAIPPGGPTLR
jgi:transglutaminase-like putative cysteine protease